MTKMPERIALSHAFGGLAAALVGVSEYHQTFGLGLHGGHLDALGTIAIRQASALDCSPSPAAWSRSPSFRACCPADRDLRRPEPAQRRHDRPR